MPKLCLLLRALIVTLFCLNTNPASADEQLNLFSLGTASQSGGAAVPRPASMAIDGNTVSFSETPVITNAFWELELQREVRITRVELVAPSSAPNGLVLRIADLRDRTLFQATVSGVVGGGTWATNLPAPVQGRIVRFALENGSPNGVGEHRVALSEVRLYGDPSPAFGPVVLGAAAVATQSSTNFPPQSAVDRSTTTTSETLNLPDSFWLLTLDRPQPVQRVEIISPVGANAARMDGLTLRLLDNSSNTVASASVFNPGSGNNWIYTPPPGTVASALRIGLENGATNGQGNQIVSLAEVNVHTAENWALGAVSYMTRSHDALPPAAFANDDSYATTMTTHSSTVDSYWEVDLGQTRALYNIRTVAGAGFQGHITHTTVRLFDENHDSVFAQHHPTNSLDVFDVPLPGPVYARYVRVGLENKERTNPSGGTGWQIGMKEVQAYGRASNEIGILSFTATQTQIVAGASTQLNWQEEDLFTLTLHPGIGSVGSNTAPSGAGSRTVTLTNSTEFILVGSNYSGVFTRHLAIKVNGQSLPARISEFVADNSLSLRDGNKAASDWIEIHNPNNETLDLSGYGLSDNPALPMKWTFPAGVTLAPHGYLLVFASDSNQPFDPAGFLHASFSLNADGESVVLTAPNGTTTIDSITNYPPQREDLAYGRTLEGNWTFLEPTPGAPNVATAYEGWLEPIEFSHKRGWHTNAFSLVITNANPASEVFYSLDGTEPSILYTAPIPISSTLPVRAQVVRANYKSPRTKTHTYLFVETILAQPAMSTTYTQGPTWTNRLRKGLRDLPTLAVSVPPAPPVVNSERIEREASVEIFLPDGSDPIQANCGITHFGGAFGSGTGNPYEKKSYQLKFRASYGTRKLDAPLFKGFDHSILSQDSFDELDLHAGNHDMTQRGFYLSHRFAADTMLDMGSLNPHGRFVHLYINGVYWGQYDAHERLTDSFLSEYLGGAVEDYVTVRGNDNGPSGNFILGVPEPPNRATWEYVLANRGSYTAITNYVDVANLIDFMLVWNWGNAEAEYRSAGAIAPGVGGFKFWLADADGHLRNQSGVSSALTRNATANTGPGLIFGALFAEGHADFKVLLKDRIYKAFFNNGPMSPLGNLQRMNARMNEITNSMVAECARWGSLTGRNPGTWQSDAQYARDNLLPYRSTNLVTYLRAAGWYPSPDANAFNQAGGSVTNGFGVIISGPGALFYTLDGTDPRLPGGQVSPSAILWNGVPFIIQSNTVITVRVRLGPSWSAINQATFIVSPIRQPAPGDLVFTEIHYNPPGSDDYEFIEIQNTSTNVLDIGSVRVDDGVEYLFPGKFYLSPGEFVLVVENAAAFGSRYSTNSSPYFYPNLRVAGEWNGQLSNSGERLALIASNGVELAAVSYSTGGSWPSRADSRGSSLELRNPADAAAIPANLNAHLDRGPNWRSSALYHGTPGRLDLQPRDIAINEVVAHTDIDVDWIELHNATANPIDLSEFYLSDNYGLPFRYAFPSNTVIPASGYLIRTATQLGFGFSELGSDIILVQASGTNILRYVDTTDIPASAREEPFGRYTRSDGVVDFTELRAKTQAADNALPRIGPVVFSEIMYNPPAGRSEFVELVNLSTTNVPLYDPARPTNTWELSDAVEFKFPPGQVLAPGAVVLVSATNPAAFRAEYGISPAILVYGPWTGALNNAGESLRLRRPGAPETNGFVPYYRVDRVRYEPIAPWPVEADGTGASLERVTIEGYGNDPANWEASGLNGSPGTFVGNRPPGVATDDQTVFPEGTLATFTVYAIDPDEPWQSATVDAINLPAGSSFNPATGVFSWLTGEEHGPGEYPLEFVAHDNGLIPTVQTQILVLTIEEANSAPSVQSIANVLSPALVPLTVNVNATDPDLPAQSLSYSASGLPAGLLVNPASGQISGTPQSPGIYPVTVFASDNQVPPLQGEREFTMTITEPFQMVAFRPVGGDPQFSFWTLPGETYEIYFTPQLEPADWELVQRIESAGGGLQSVPTLPASPTHTGFVRVLWIRD